MSAKSGDQVALLADLLVGLLPEGPQLYPDGDLSDAPEEILVAELIREAALDGLRDELPHSVAVVVEEMRLREDRPEDKPLLDIHANLYVERDSQKGIIIGPKGARLKAIGTTSRKQIEALLGTPGLPRPARQDRQGLAARPEAAAQARLLMPRPAPVAAWHAVAASRDPAGLAALLADDVVFRSPAVHTPQEGKALTTAYLSAAMVVLGPTLDVRPRVVRRRLRRPRVPAPSSTGSPCTASTC